MEKYHTSSYEGPTEVQRLYRVAEVLNTAGTAKQNISRFPTVAEVVKIENQGYDFRQVNDYLNTLDQGYPTQIRTAAMLRGAFNDLLRQINGDEASPLPPPPDKTQP